jgi:hypothetical protein
MRLLSFLFVGYYSHQFWNLVKGEIDPFLNIVMINFFFFCGSLVNFRVKQKHQWSRNVPKRGFVCGAMTDLEDDIWAPIMMMGKRMEAIQ